MSVVEDALVATVSAMVKILIVFIMAMIAAHTDLLTVDMIRGISKLSFNFVGPCLVLANLSRSLSVDLLRTHWVVIPWAMFTVTTGYAIGFVVTRLTKIRKEFGNTVVSATAFNNSLNIPLVIFESLASCPFFIDDPETYRKATAFCLIYGIGWNIVMYTIGYVYLLGEEFLDTAPTTHVAPISNASSSVQESSPLAPLPIFIAFPAYVFSLIARVLKRIYRFLVSPFSWPSWIGKKARFALTAIVTNPFLIAQFASLAIGLIPSLKAELFTPGTALRPVMQAIEFVANAAIPLGTMITAGNAYHSFKMNYSQDARRKEYQIIELMKQNNRGNGGSGNGTIVAGDTHNTDEDSILPSINSPSDTFVELSDLQQQQPDHTTHTHTHAHMSGNSAGTTNTITAGASNLSITVPSNTRAPVALPDTMGIAGYPVTYDFEQPYPDTHSHTSHTSHPHGLTHTYSDNPFQSSTNTLGGGGGGGVTDPAGGVYDDHSIFGSQIHTNLQLARVFSPTIMQVGPTAGAPAAIEDASFFEYDKNGELLPLPRLTMFQMFIVCLGKLVVSPLLVYGVLVITEQLQWTWLADGFLFKIVLILCALAPSSEAVMTIVTKSGNIRGSMALSLVYVMEYALCFVTIPICLTYLMSKYSE